MRLLWLTEHYPPSRGGMAQSCDRIVRGLRGAAVEVDVVHLRRRSPAAAADRLPRHTREPGGGLVTAPLTDDPEHALRRLWTVLAPQAAGYHAVVAFGGTYPVLAAPVYARWCGAPLVTLLRGNDFDTGVFSLRRQPVLLEALRASAHVCVVASGTAPLVSALAPGTPVSLVSNGIDLRTWEILPSERARAAAWRAANVAPGRRAIGLIGQLKSKKGVRFLLDAIAACGHADRLHVVLVGEVEDGIAASLAERPAGLPATVLPFLDRFELPAVYAACDVVALPSYYDGLPNVALEAAALGIPLLASDAGGLADLVDDAIGFRFVAGDPHGCRAAVHRDALATDEHLAELGSAAASRVRQRFTPAAETEGYLRVFRSLRRAGNGAGEAPER